MARFLHRFDTFTFRRSRHVLLALSWVFGLGFGALTFRYGKDQLLSLMPPVLSSRWSIVGLAASSFLPFLFSVFAVYISFPLLLTLICFSRAFLYAYIACGIQCCFGDAGWLVRWLLLFSDTLSIPVLYLYWQRHISGCRSFRMASAVGYLTILGLISALGYFLTAPLTAALSF